MPSAILIHTASTPSTAHQLLPPLCIERAAPCGSFDSRNRLNRANMKRCRTSTYSAPSAWPLPAAACSVPSRSPSRRRRLQVGCHAARRRPRSSCAAHELTTTRTASTRPTTCVSCAHGCPGVTYGQAERDIASEGGRASLPPASRYGVYRGRRACLREPSSRCQWGAVVEMSATSTFATVIRRRCGAHCSSCGT